MSTSVGSSVVTNVPLWWGMLIMGEPVIVWGQREDEKSLYLLLNFSVNLKLLKNIFFNEKNYIYILNQKQIIWVLPIIF